MKRTRWLPLTVAIVLALAAGCSRDKGVSLDVPDVAGPDRKLAGEPVPGELVSANTRFAFDIYREVLKTGGTKNVFISPSSVSLALTMTYNGADGTTKEAMARVLGVEGMDLDELSRANAILISNLIYGDEDLILEIANSLWARQGVTFRDEFMNRNQTFYFAGLFPITTAAAINDWVSEKTHEKITHVLDDPLPAEAILYLVNAIYFKGTWTHEFDKADTRNRPFYLTGGGQKSVPMMELADTLRYCRGDGFQAVSLPYGDGRFSMYVFLPDENSSLAEFQARLTPENWEAWMGEFGEAEGDIYLPRFKIEYERLLNNQLTGLGMGVAFEPYGANFGKMLPVEQFGGENVYISRVIHKTFCEVNEEGTEAAAVTIVEIGVTCPSEPQKFLMRMDRPFFFAIRDNESGAILFMGSVLDPAS